MKYTDFVEVMTKDRMNRYLLACGGDSRKAMTLYRKNLKLSQELFTIISCFEVALRNAIDKQLTGTLGNNWLKEAALTNGIFDNSDCKFTKLEINKAVGKLGSSYSHNKLIAELGFGFWRFFFAQHQFNATGRILLRIFPSKPKSTVHKQYNAKFILKELAELNEIRNRIAHHEPICFQSKRPIKDTTYVRQHYNLILHLFQWMQINETALLYGLDHINTICNDIDSL